MKRFLFLASSVLLISSAFSQTNADCINAIPLCSTPNFTFFGGSGVGTYTDLTNTSAHNISNPSTNPTSSNSGCLLAGELKPQWLLITIGNTGSLEFVFGASNSQHPQAGLYDWAMWKYDPNTCANIQNNTLPPVRCNWNGSGSGGTGIAPSTNLPPGGSSSNFEPPLPVKACEQYIICISNYSGVNTLVSFQSTGTASLSCNPNCLNVTSGAICSGSSYTMVGASSSTLTNITYSLNPGGLTSNTPTFIVTPSVTTNYTFYATGQGQTGPVTQTAVSGVTVNANPVAVPSVTQSACTNSLNGFNLNLTFTPQPASPSYTITWNPIPATITNPTQTASPDTSYTPPGTYVATITTAAGCSTTASFTLATPPVPADFGFSPAGPVYSVTCYQPTVTIAATLPAYNYTWTNGLIAQQTGSVAQMNFTGTGTWTVTAVHPVSGCVATKTIIVGINVTTPSSALTPTFQNITCTLSSVTTITATALSPTVNFVQYVLSPFGGSVAVPSTTMHYVPGGVGTYTHFVVNTVNGCSTAKTFSVVSSQGFPTFTLQSPQNYTLGCNSRSVAVINILNAQATATLAGAVSYSLLFTNTATPNTTLSTVSVYSVNVPGTYTVVVKNNANMCETRVPVSILSNTFAPGIDTVIVPNSILTCFTPSTQLEGFSPTSNVNYQWLLPGNQSISGNKLLVDADFSSSTKTLVGTYIFKVEDNSSTCTSTLAVPILQNIYKPFARMSAGSPSITCSILEITISNNSSTGIQGNFFPKGKPVVGYVWDGPSPQETRQLTSSYVAKVPGFYTLTAMDMNNGCTSNTIVQIFDGREYPAVNQPPIGTPTTVLDCGADFAFVRPNYAGSKANYSYTWTAPAGATTSSKNDSLLRTNMLGDYRVVVTNTVTGCTVSSIMKVTAGKLSAGFEPSKSTGYAPMDVQFTNLSKSTLGTQSISTVWVFGNGKDSTVNSVAPVTTRYTQPGTYTVTMYVRKGTCIDTVEKTIVVDIPSRLVIPNVFTPNGDGANDEFFLHTANLETIEMEIYDRWGNKVFEVTSPTGNVLWDGKNRQGQQLPEGSYFFVLKAKGKDGKEFDEKGTISLLR